MAKRAQFFFGYLLLCIRMHIFIRRRRKFENADVRKWANFRHNFQKEFKIRMLNIFIIKILQILTMISMKNRNVLLSDANFFCQASIFGFFPFFE